MKKYKLIKSYPNSENIGSIWTKRDIDENYWYTNCYLIPEDVENNPEFFEEIIQKDFEILSLKDTNCQQFTFHLKKNGLYGTSTDTNELGSQTLESLLQFSWKIFSIRRLSDNEVFSIGDNVDWKLHKNHYKITEIKLFNEVPVIVLSPKDVPYELSSNLSNITKTKPVLFVTEDGVKLFKNDKVNSVNKTTFILNCGESEGGTIGSDFIPSDKYVYFSTKEKAQEWIVLNKAVLSLQDVLNCTVYAQKIILEDELKELVKSRL